VYGFSDKKDNQRVNTIEVKEISAKLAIDRNAIANGGAKF
jgi:hypothetical protein